MKNSQSSAGLNPNNDKIQIHSRGETILPDNRGSVSIGESEGLLQISRTVLPKTIEEEIWLAVDRKTGRPEHATPIFHTQKSCQEWLDKTPWTRKKLFVQKCKLILPEHEYMPWL
jgi:hypothetical protein